MLTVAPAMIEEVARSCTEFKVTVVVVASGGGHTMCPTQPQLPPYAQFVAHAPLRARSNGS
jgi:hypothetical protein